MITDNVECRICIVFSLRLMKHPLIVAIIALLLTSCSSDIDLSKFEQEKVETVYKIACEHMEKGEYSDAIKIFDELERLYPYSKYTALVQIKSGDCYHKMKKYEEAASEYEIFIKTHRTHEMVPYAIYKLGVVYYEQMPIIERDQEVTIKSLAYLRTLLQQFPGSKHEKEANKIIDELRQQLAGREVYIAKYYQKRGNFAAAVGRLNTVLDSYDGTNHIPEAMHRLVECYVTMGFFDEAKNINKILQKEFSKTKWAAYSKKLIPSKAQP